LEVDRLIEKSFSRNEIKQILNSLCDIIIRQDKFYEAEIETMVNLVYSLGTDINDTNKSLFNSLKSAFNDFCEINQQSLLDLVKTIIQEMKDFS